jgi:cell division protein FtsN
MAETERKGGHYEMTLENRHLLGVFFAVVLLCAIFFTLGFVLGRNQAAAKAPASPPQKPSAQAPAAPAPDDLTFYERVEGKPPAETLPATKPAEKPPAAKPAETKPAAATAKPAPAKPAAPAETFYLQVAAVTQEAEAQRLVGELKRRGFSSVIIPPSADPFYRVQVGPLESADLAEAAKARLEAQGYRQVLKIRR